jgi:hypothetical protein
MFAKPKHLRLRLLRFRELPTGETLTYWQAQNGTCTVDVTLKKDDPIAISSTADTVEDALLTLAARFKTLGIELENLASKAP